MIAYSLPWPSLSVLHSSTCWRVPHWRTSVIMMRRGKLTHISLKTILLLPVTFKPLSSHALFSPTLSIMKSHRHAALLHLSVHPLPQLCYWSFCLIYSAWFGRGDQIKTGSKMFCILHCRSQSVMRTCSAQPSYPDIAKCVCFWHWGLRERAVCKARRLLVCIRSQGLVQASQIVRAVAHFNLRWFLYFDSSPPAFHTSEQMFPAFACIIQI